MLCHFSIRSFKIMARKPYTTKARTEILEYIKENSSLTVSASDIENHLKQSGFNTNATTIYRYLEKLCDEQIIVKYPDKSGEKSVYQLSDEEKDCNNHLHLKCVSCGKLIHMDCDFINEMSEHIKKNHNFNIIYKGNMLYGICENCAKNKKDKK